MTQVVIKDRVKELSSSTGTGSMTLDGAVQGFQSFAAIGNGNLTFYTIAREGNFEVGIGMYLTSGPTLQRNVVLDSSNSGNLVNWGVGEKEVFVTLPASAADFVPDPNVFEYLTTSLAGTGALGSANAIVDILVDFLVIAGGGGGGSQGGGGAGGYREFSAQTLYFGTAYTVTVGAGGTGRTGASPATGQTGSNSVFNTITSSGGGFGGNFTGNGGSGGSGGGGGGADTGGTAGGGGAGTIGQGNNGAAGTVINTFSTGGGGGGASAAGQVGVNNSFGGQGGAGTASSITGSSVTRAGGGSGGGSLSQSGGAGGGGAGGASNNNGSAGTANTGGGGGGGGNQTSTNGGNGGSGIVILKYPDSVTISSPGGGLTFTTSTAVAGFKITTFTAGTGNIQWSV